MKTKRSVTQLLLMFATFALSCVALGEEGAHEGSEEGIPRIVFYQAINFFAFVGILYYLLKNKVGDFFKQRHETVAAALHEANRIKTEAENKHQEYVIKIQELQKEQASVLEAIRKDGEESKRRIMEEGKRLAESIRAEAKRSAENEIEKARTELYDEVLQSALEGARTLLVKSVAENDQRRLQKEFVEKIEAVQ